MFTGTIFGYEHQPEESVCIHTQCLFNIHFNIIIPPSSIH